MKQKGKNNRSNDMLVSSLYDAYNLLGDAVIVINADGYITRMNSIAEKLTGWSLLETRGKPLPDVFQTINPETGEKEEHINNIILKSGRKAGFNCRTILLSNDGSGRSIKMSVTPIHKNDTTIIGFVLIFRDVTDQHLIELQNQLSQKIEVLGQLSGGIVHDFNNILTGISGCAELLLRTIDESDSNRKFITMIAGAIEEAAEMIKRLLVFSQKSKLRSAPMDVHSCINNVVNNLGCKIGPKITIRTELKADISTIVGDLSQIQNVIINLVLNAIDSMKNGGEITLATLNVLLDEAYLTKCFLKPKTGSYIEIRVCDTGIGMTKDTQRRIFDPFFSTKNTGKNTGLGLASVYRILYAHHGAIYVSSQVNKGTNVNILLPINR